MLKIWPRGDERGVSVVLGAALVAGLFITASTIFLSSWIPEQGKQKEREHLAAVEDSFLELKSGIQVLRDLYESGQTLGSRTISIPMKRESALFVPSSGEAGGILINPMKGEKVAKCFWAQTDWSGGETGPDNLEVLSWPETTDKYCRGENVDAAENIKLQKSGPNYRKKGYVESSVFYASDLREWGKIEWGAETPTMVISEENFPVTGEPVVLKDGEKRFGVVVGGGLENAGSLDNVYENIAENDLGRIDNYAPVTSHHDEKGSTSNFTNMQSWTDSGAYATLSEREYTDYEDKILNGTFESGWNNWATYHAGDMSLEIGSEGSNHFAMGYIDRINFLSSRTYEGSGWIQQNFTVNEIPSTATLTFRWKKWHEWGLIQRLDIAVQLFDPDGSERYEWTDTSTTPSDWNNVQADVNIDKIGSWTIKLSWDEEGRSTPYFLFWYWLSMGANFDDVQLTLRYDRYDMEIYDNVDGIPAGMDNYYLEMRYKRNNTNDAFEVWVWNFSSSSWSKLGADLTATAWSSWVYPNWVYQLSPDQISENQVKVKFVDKDPQTLEATDLLIDYLRVRGSREAPNFLLVWEHKIENVPADYANYNLSIHGYSDNDENVSVYIWNFTYGNWEFVSNLGTKPGSSISYELDPIGNYLSSENTLHVKYKDQTYADDNQTTIHIDFCAVKAADIFDTHLKVEIRTGTDSDPYLDGGSPDTDNWSGWVEYGNGDTIISPADKTYIQYRVQLSTENEIETPTFKDIKIEYNVLAFENYGTIEFTVNNLFYPEQKLVYEVGAIILVQGGTALMKSPPAMFTVKKVGDNVEVLVDVVNIENFKTSYISTGTATVEFWVDEVSLYDRAGIPIGINTTYEDAWRKYLHERCEELRMEGYDAVVDDDNLALMIENAPVHYYLRTTTVKVRVS